MRSREKQNDYFEMFVHQSEFACRAADIISELVKNFDAFDIPDTVEKVHAIEFEADTVKRKLTEALSKEFLPPIEREDILTLSNELDDVTDNVEDILRNIYMYNITSIRPRAVEFVCLVRESCEAMKEMICEFRSFKKSDKLGEYIKKVNELEEKGDELYTDAMRELHTASSDPKELIAWTGLYTIIETCCDCCEHVADAVEMAAMKNT